MVHFPSSFLLLKWGSPKLLNVLAKGARPKGTSIVQQDFRFPLSFQAEKITVFPFPSLILLFPSRKRKAAVESFLMPCVLGANQLLDIRMMFLVGSILILIQCSGQTSFFRFSSDGFGFSVNASSRLNCSQPARPQMTGYGNWPGTYAFAGGVFDGTYVWLVPWNSNRVVRLDPSSGSMTGYSNWPTGTTSVGNRMFWGGVFDGSFIWLVPQNCDRIIRIDPRTGTMTGYRGWPVPIVSYAFCGGVFDGTSIWLVPYFYSRVVRFNVQTGIMTGYPNWPAGTASIGYGAFVGGVFDGTYIWLIPYHANRVIRIDPSSGIMTGYSAWPVGTTKSGYSFFGGVFDGSFIWLVPSNFDRVVRLDPASGAMTGYNNWPAGITGIKNGAFVGGVFDGTYIWLVPSLANQVVRLQPSTGNMVGYSNWPAGTWAARTFAFAGGVFDGFSIWLVPCTSNRVVSIGLNCTAPWRPAPLTRVSFTASVSASWTLASTDTSTWTQSASFSSSGSVSSTSTPTPPENDDAALPCSANLCHGRGNVTGSVVTGCFCSCEKGYNSSTNCSTPLSCPVGMCNARGMVLGDIISGCNCNCLVGYDTSTNCSTPLLCPPSHCNYRGNVTGDLVGGCSCSCESGWDPQTNCSTQLSTSTHVVAPPTGMTTTVGPQQFISSAPITSATLAPPLAPQTTVLPTSTPHNVTTRTPTTTESSATHHSTAPVSSPTDVPPTTRDEATPAATPPQTADCPSQSSSSAILLQAYETMWLHNKTEMNLNASGPWDRPCNLETACVVEMTGCTTAQDGSSKAGATCEDHERCVVRYIDCLFRAAIDESNSNTDCPRLKELSASLGSVRKGKAEYNDSAAYVSCRASACRMIQTARRGLPTCGDAGAAAVSRCPAPSGLIKRRTRLVRLSGSSTAALVSGVMGRAPAVVVVLGGTAGIALAAAIYAPTSVTKAAALGSLSRVAGCAFVDEDTAPSMLDFPIQLPIGSSSFALFVGSGFVSIGLLVAVPIATTLIFSRVGSRSAVGRKVQKKLIANVALLALGYFGPQAFKLPLLILWHSGDPLERAIAVLCPVLTLCALTPLLEAVIRQFDSAVLVVNSPQLQFHNRQPESLFVETYGLLFGGARSTRMIHRLLFFVDLCVACVLQLLDGFRPERDTSCGTVAGLMAAACWFHTTYLLIVRPYRQALELGLAILGSVLMSMMASFAFSVSLGISESNVEDSPYYIAFSYLGLCCTFYFFFQSVILAIAGAFASLRGGDKDDAKVVPKDRFDKLAADRPFDVGQQSGLLLAAPLLENDSTLREYDDPLDVEADDESEGSTDDSESESSGERGIPVERYQHHPSVHCRSQPNPLKRSRF